MVQEEQGAILKVNKQKRGIVKVLTLLSSQQRGKLGQQGRRTLGFPTQVHLLVFHLWLYWKTS